MKFIEKLEGKCDNGLELSIEPQSFYFSDGCFVYDHMNGPEALVESCKCEDNPKTLHLLFIALLYAVSLKAPAESISALKTKINSLGVPDSEIKQIMKLIIEDQDIIKQVNKIVNEVLKFNKGEKI